MKEKSKAAAIIEEICKIPYVLNIKSPENRKIIVYLSEDIPEAMKNTIRNTLLQISDKLEVSFEIVEKKGFWQRFLESLNKTFGNFPPGTPSH